MAVSILPVITLLWTLGRAQPIPNLLPAVINTWPFVDANRNATSALLAGRSAVDAVEVGCSTCEVEQCDGSVGYGGSPDENGETTLDAMIMDGETHDVGAVGCIRRIKSAISVARNVMERTSQTFLVGDQATEFAKEMGFKEEDLHTPHSVDIWNTWKSKNCQPNYWIPGTVSPDPLSSCGPYSPMDNNARFERQASRTKVNPNNHDTIGMVAIDEDGKIACGTSTNGLTYKIAGRVGDSPIAGAGCYVEKGVGGAAATGDGDVMMRFLPTFLAVESMRQGLTPTDAAEQALAKISSYYPTFVGALVAINITGHYGGANHKFQNFKFTVYNPSLGKSTVVEV